MASPSTLTMQAVVQRTTGGPDVLLFEQLPRPRVKARDVLIRVAACGVCFHDIVVRNGTLKKGVELPVIPGPEIAGVVEAVGDEVTRVAPGQRIATTQRYHVCGMCRFCRGGLEPLCAQRRFLGDHGLVGGYAEYVAVEEDNVVRIPEGVSDEQAAIAACAIGTALNAVRDVGRVTIGERVLVAGAGGGVGVHAVQLARLAGAFVIAQTTSQDKAARSGNALAKGTAVTRTSLEVAARQAGVTVQRGDVVLVRTGWIETMLHDPRYYDGEPGIDVEAARWLADAGVAVIGSDNFAVEHIPFPQGTVFPVHQLVIRNYGIALLEGLMLKELAASGTTEFLFVATPLPFVGGTGSPLVPLAIL